MFKPGQSGNPIGRRLRHVIKSANNSLKFFDDPDPVEKGIDENFDYRSFFGYDKRSSNDRDRADRVSPPIERKRPATKAT